MHVLVYVPIPQYKRRLFLSGIFPSLSQMILTTWGTYVALNLLRTATYAGHLLTAMSNFLWRTTQNLTVPVAWIRDATGEKEGARRKEGIFIMPRTYIIYVSKYLPT